LPQFHRRLPVVALVVALAAMLADVGSIFGAP
jgi:hypothetical protein